MSLSSVRGLFVHCWSRLYRKDVKTGFSTLGKISIVREPCRPNIMLNFIRSSSTGHTITPNTWVSPEEEHRKLLALLPEILTKLTENKRYSDIPVVNEWFRKVLNYSMPKGRELRGIPLVNAYRMIARPEQLTEENLRLARIAAWVLEISEQFFLIVDDILDQSEMRRHRPCWYLHNDIGLAATNDGLLCENAAYELLRIYFKGKDCYINLVEQVQESSIGTLMGQSLEHLTSNFGKKLNLDLFTMDRFLAINKYKCGYYLYLPTIRIPMYLAGLSDPEMHRQVKPILIEFGYYIQIQNDYLDCYGDPNVTGKIGSDIRDGRCTWPIVTALECATSEQRQILDECYGSKDPEKVKLVERVYDDIGLPDMYLAYEKEASNRLSTQIQQLSFDRLNNFFFKLLEYNRAEHARGPY